MGEDPAGRIIDGATIATRMYEEIDEGIAALDKRGLAPHLAAIQVGQDEATDVYVSKQKERFARRGIRFTHLSLDRSVTTDSLLHHLDAFNDNPTITGIILTLPLPDGVSAHRIQEQIHPEKDVEGINPTNLGRLIYNRHAVGPCTALATLAAIDATGVPVEGKNVVIVGHSDIVGKPLGLCLLQQMATVTTCHIATRDLAKHTREADILVVAVGKPDLIRADMIKPGAVIVDVGISRLEGGRITGDVAYDEVAPRSGWITPVPGGIGPITVAMLARNTLICANEIFAEA